MKALLVNIKRNSLDDGPGIRTVFFFKGCPLKCVWCQNPETKSGEQEIIFEKEKCTECGECANVCMFGAIDLNNPYPIERENCVSCGDCIDVCQPGALKFAAKEYSVEELVNIALKDKVFFQNSGGGVTLSGGEPTIRMKFLHEFVKFLKEQEIHICVETCGYFNLAAFKELILPYIDLIYYDLKLFDAQEHNSFCGLNNKTIFKNLEELILNKTVEILPRIPLIPEVTATEKNLSNLAKYLKTLKIKKIGLLPYNPLWQGKPKTLGRETQYNREKWMTKKEKEKVKKIFRGFEFRDF